MHIHCPSCSTKFEINIDNINNNQKLKCSECKYIWAYQSQSGHEVDIQEFDDVNIESEENTGTIVESSNLNEKQNIVHLPAIIHKPYEEKNSYMFTAFITGMIFFLLIMIFPETTKKYLSPSKDLFIANAYIDREDDGELYLKYQLHNTSNKINKIPTVRVRFLNKHHEILQEFFDKPNLILNPHQKANITTKIIFSKDILEQEKIDINNDEANNDAVNNNEVKKVAKDQDSQKNQNNQKIQTSKIKNIISDIDISIGNKISFWLN